MPVYEYACDKCGVGFDDWSDTLVAFADRHAKCPKCHHTGRPVFSRFYYSGDKPSRQGYNDETLGGFVFDKTDRSRRMAQRELMDWVPPEGWTEVEYITKHGGSSKEASAAKQDALQAPRKKKQQRRIKKAITESLKH